MSPKPFHLRPSIYSTTSINYVYRASHFHVVISTVHFCGHLCFIQILLISSLFRISYSDLSRSFSDLSFDYGFDLFLWYARSSRSTRGTMFLLFDLRPRCRWRSKDSIFKSAGSHALGRGSRKICFLMKNNICFFGFTVIPLFAAMLFGWLHALTVEKWTSAALRMIAIT
uniref:Uncharacterized protein n=1 Tax=Nicotiana tabacum TaxID=4097 RepID=A0A1S4BMC4_TOBAC|nr:PREDICTED: uncharacterized protein LOC107809827 [Nicotiana tabacum]